MCRRGAVAVVDWHVEFALYMEPDRSRAIAQHMLAASVTDVGRQWDIMLVMFGVWASIGRIVASFCFD